MTLSLRESDRAVMTAPPWPQGFRGAGVAAGIKKAGVADLALLVADSPATAAAVFTKNLIAAAPIAVSKANLVASHGLVRALMVNSGCANAATGPDGLHRAHASSVALARSLGVAPHEVLINSTGVIGVALPLARIEAAIPLLVTSATAGSCESFARAIMTTDTRPKWSSRTILWNDAHGTQRCRITGVAKGAGMIHPNMATMICVIATDAVVAPDELDSTLREVVEGSFHRISVDGDTSTNDSVFALASGVAGAPPRPEFHGAMAEVAAELAQMVVRDGEGFERGLEVRVTGARTTADALEVARTVASSLLVRTAVTGGDPNWGRILAAAGRAGVAFDPNSIRVGAGGITLFEHGAPARVDLGAVRAAFSADSVLLTIDLGMGSCCDRFWSCGLTTRYVALNSEYTS
ncbi:MAG: bifunctional glutamate N-acetyltransferase/amino-acid acetyltransferase ArgJ [Phycisphaerales bacterium]|nr:bifunctional glutamate N-acetyltransferase/amino-acid acetyltransferase ArgJ [Phycisphaerales bacterium]